MEHHRNSKQSRRRLILEIIGLASLLLGTWIIHVYHVSIFPKPTLSPADRSQQNASHARWIDRRVHGINQLVVSGTPYARGLASGRFTKHLMYREEKELTARLHQFFSNPLLFRAFEITAFRWFWGIDTFFEPWMVEEMYGVAQSASHEFDYLADPLTRQVAYHGVHEVGQMMVDQTGDDRGCTVLAIPYDGAWIIGRNFDFEGSRVLDTEKIMKWVFPDHGYAFVSVTWAGMVGVVTGVNEHGLYISLNAAGSQDYVRFGTPSTLVLLKALQFSKTIEEALVIIRDAQMFITDIFVVSDVHSGTLFKVEKSPKHTEIIPLTQASVVANHLTSPYWSRDRINVFRRDKLTSQARIQRGQSLLSDAHLDINDGDTLDVKMLSFLRDKTGPDGEKLNLGNRRAIDPLIATHSIIYNERKKILYVSQGPGVSGAFTGFDLETSFRTRIPTTTKSLPSDDEVTETTFYNVRNAIQTQSYASKLSRYGQCAKANALLSQASRVDHTSYSYYTALGDVLRCLEKPSEAEQAWKAALLRSPAYDHEVRALKERLSSLTK